MTGEVGKRALRRHWYERFPRALPVGIFLLTSAVTLVSVAAIESTETKRRVTQLSQTAKVLASALERRADTHEAYLRSGAAVFSTQQAVSGSLFQTYLSQLRLDSDYRGAEGIGWAMRVDREDIPQVQRDIRAHGPSNFTIHPLPTDDQVYAVPVTYLQPETERNRGVLGYNMYSNSVRRMAMAEAVRFSRPTATGKLVLAQDRSGSHRPGFVIYMPVFRIGSDGAKRLSGFVYSPFVAETFLHSALQLENSENVGIRLYDRSIGPANLLAQTPLADPSGVTVTEPLAIANRPWVLQVESSRPSTLSSMSLLTMLFGMLVASLLLVLARLVTRQAAEDRQALTWLEEQASIRNSLTRELNHRVKNTLANVLSILSLTRRRATDLDSFASSLEGRIRALSATHDLLTQSDWGSTPIGAVVRAELAPYAQDSERALDISGPAVELAPNDALSLGLAIHELATNAAKYGALSVPTGQVAVTWHLITQDLARIEWAERGGPPVSQGARKRGFGTELIEKIVAHELRNPVELKFEPEGVRCALILPVRMPVDFALRSRPQSKG
ncbi:CHASE domain-containing protein [Novosphingobium sp. Gsoil 351]|uniref:CHASE domain-containing protein n=1 Tax=Novosphingobium sp. Gsoil 351 TaxID=2675225 RepID=UPI0012B4DECD|nr:CHASE domain-containing protein [Novosphingobium sp. Gsoil 351]QGN55224.1 histidine kinase [Novosphingobium sp. Gsoil 351]